MPRSVHRGPRTVTVTVRNEREMSLNGFVAGVELARAQTITASLFPAAFQPDRLTGEIKGTGSAGTTFVLAGVLSATETGVTTEAVPITGESFPC